jgi:hypothetical protein
MPSVVTVFSLYAMPVHLACLLDVMMFAAIGNAATANACKQPTCAVWSENSTSSFHNNPSSDDA